MPAPVYAAGTPANLMSGVSVAASKTVAVFLDISTDVEGQVTCELITGATAPTNGTSFGAYKAYAAGSAPPFTLTGAVVTSATSLPLSGALGLHDNQKIALVSASTGQGEVVTLTAAPSGTGAQSIACSALINAYNSGDHVYLMAQSPAFAVAPAAPLTGTWIATTDYSGSLFLGPAQWIVAANNTDTAQTVTVSLTVDRITSFQ